VNPEVRDALAKALDTQTAVALATVTGTKGSTPRKAGAKMLIQPDGSFCGTIGGGCGESEVWAEAMETLKDGKPRLVRVDLTNPIDGPDKICGGTMDVFVQLVQTS
jgi:xanthine dehydrogenase accessory factor